MRLEGGSSGRIRELVIVNHGRRFIEELLTKAVTASPWGSFDYIAGAATPDKREVILGD